MNFDKDLIPNLTSMSNRLFESLKQRQLNTGEEFKYFRFDLKKTCNLGKLYLLPKIHKRLSNVLGGPVISNYGAPTEKVCEFLDSHMQPITKRLVTADAVGLYPSIPHNVGLRALKEALDKREQKKIPTEDLLQMAEFVLKNNFFEFNIKSNSKSLGQL